MRDVTCKWRNCTRHSTLITLPSSIADQRLHMVSDSADTGIANP